MRAVAVGPAGRFILAGGTTIRKIGADGLVHTLLRANDLDAFLRMAVDRQGNIYYSAALGIIKLTPSGATARVVGIAVDPGGRVVFSDGHTKRVWRIDSSGTLHAVTGAETAGTGSEGGPAVSAQLESPQDLAYDAAGSLYILDQHRILKIAAAGVQYAGPAPGFAGLSQINVQIPQTPSGAQAVQAPMGTAPFLQSVQLWVK